MFSPVSVGVDPELNSRFNVPDGLLVLLPTGSACHWKVWFTALPVLLLNADADWLVACELKPFVAVAVLVGPSENRPSTESCPRMAPLPLTSSVAAGAVVLIPTLAVGDAPDWKIAELPRSPLLSIHRGMKSVVPEPPMVGVPDEPGFGGKLLEPGLGAASTKADAGSPPTVCASPAFIA